MRSNEVRDAAAQAARKYAGRRNKDHPDRESLTPRDAAAFDFEQGAAWERERCAGIAEGLDGPCDMCGSDIAAAIREVKLSGDTKP